MQILFPSCAISALRCVVIAEEKTCNRLRWGQVGGQLTMIGCGHRRLVREPVLPTRSSVAGYALDQRFTWRAFLSYNFIAKALAYSWTYGTPASVCSSLMVVRGPRPRASRRQRFCMTCSRLTLVFEALHHKGAPYIYVGLRTVLNRVSLFSLEVAAFTMIGYIAFSALPAFLALLTVWSL